HHTPPLSLHPPPPPPLYTLSLHDALPISPRRSWRERYPAATTGRAGALQRTAWPAPSARTRRAGLPPAKCCPFRWKSGASRPCRSEEHTSELQSLRHLVCRLLLEKKKNKE